MQYLLLAGPLLFILTVLVLQKISPDYNPKNDYISELALGKYGFIQKANFILSGLLIMLLCIHVAKINTSAAPGWYAGTFAGFVTMFAGIWDTDVKKPKKTLEGRLHTLVYYIGIYSTFIALVLISLGNLNHVFIVIFSVTILLVNAFLYFHFFKKRIVLPQGTSQRIIIFSSLVWLDIVAMLLIFQL